MIWNYSDQSELKMKNFKEDELIKYLDKNFDEKVDFKTKEASINVRKPNWIK